MSKPGWVTAEARSGCRVHPPAPSGGAAGSPARRPGGRAPRLTRCCRRHWPFARNLHIPGMSPKGRSMSRSMQTDRATPGSATAPINRNGEAAHASDGPGGHRRQGVEPAPRHQHRDRRSVRRPDPGRAALLLPSEENIASLCGVSGEDKGRGQLPLRLLRRGDRPAHRPVGSATPGVRRRLPSLWLLEPH